MWNLGHSATALTFDDVAIREQVSFIRSRSDIDLSWRLGEFTFSIPIVSSNMTTVTGLDMARKLGQRGGLGIIHRFMPYTELPAISASMRDSSLPVCHSIGSLLNDRVRIDFMLDGQLADIICIDIAHGNNGTHMMPTIQYLKDNNFKGPIIAGNVATKFGTVNLKGWGADMVKIGIGPGSVCTTRIKTGVGTPQMSAIGDSAKVSGVGLLADGGIRYPGDAAKALAAGANAVMIGGMLAGSDCVPGWGNTGDPLYHAGNASRHVKGSFQQHNSNAEGVAKPVARKPRGSTDFIIDNLCEGIRSAMSYVGAHNLTEFREKSRFDRVSPAAAREAIPHFKEAI